MYDIAHRQGVCYTAFWSRNGSAVMISQSPYPDDGVPVDFKPVHAASEGDLAFERELLDVFLTDCARRVKNLGAVASAGDVEALRREAHTIKGAGGNVGAHRLRDLAYQIEKLDMPDQRAQAQQLTEELRKEFERVRLCVEEYLRLCT